MAQIRSSVSCDDDGINPLPLYANAAAYQVSEEEGLVRIQNASASYRSLNFDDGFSYVLKLLDHEDYKTRVNLVAQYEEFSKRTPPIGLQLRKSPSVLELFENKLNPPQIITDKAEKLKPAHFPISVFHIGNFTKVAMHEGDLVAKCYYAKRKLVWEMLDHGIKNKIEIHWQDILSMRAATEQNKPGILLIELNQPPTFWHENDPKPGKHTIWKSSKDFTGDQASKCRRHLLEFPPGVLDRHYEKLLQCDSRLLELSKGPCPRVANPYFPSIVYNEYTDFCDGYDDKRGSNSKTNQPSTCIPAPLPTTCQFGNGIQSPTSVMDTLTPPHQAINNQKLEDSDLAVSPEINDFANFLGMDSMSSAYDVQVELRRGEFNMLSNMVNMMLTTDSDLETVSDERHMAKVKSLCSFAGLSMDLEMDPPHSIKTNIKADSWEWDALGIGNSNRSLEEYPASNANANLHIYAQLSDEAMFEAPTITPIYPSSSSFYWGCGGSCT